MEENGEHDIIVNKGYIRGSQCDNIAHVRIKE